MQTPSIFKFSILVLLSEVCSLRSGGCPTLSVQSDFDFERFTGTWYAIRKTKNKSTCISYTFHKELNGAFTVLEDFRPYGYTLRGYGASQRGTVTLGSQETAKMTIAFPISILPYKKWRFYVTSTDYDNYAVVWSCFSIFNIGSQQYITLLSRQRTPDPETMKLMLDHVTEKGMDTNLLDNVDQQTCDTD